MHRSPTRPFLVLLVTVFGLATFSAYGEVKDRILAVINDETVLASDVERALGLGLAERRSGESDKTLRRRVLDQLIEDRLRFQEVDRFGFGQVPVQEVDAALEEIRNRFPSEAALEQRLSQLGMNQEALRQLVNRQLLTLAFVDERLGSRIFVSLDDIRSYYNSVLVPEMKAREETAPPMDEVREQIRTILREDRLVDEITSWTARLRNEADVLNHFDAEHESLPPVRFVFSEKRESAEAPAAPADS